MDGLLSYYGAVRLPRHTIATLLEVTLAGLPGNDVVASGYVGNNEIITITFDMPPIRDGRPQTDPPVWMNLAPGQRTSLELRVAGQVIMAANLVINDEHAKRFLVNDYCKVWNDNMGDILAIEWTDVHGVKQQSPCNKMPRYTELPLMSHGYADTHICNINGALPDTGKIDLKVINSSPLWVRPHCLIPADALPSLTSRPEQQGWMGGGTVAVYPSAHSAVMSRITNTATGEVVEVWGWPAYALGHLPGGPGATLSANTGIVTPLAATIPCETAAVGATSRCEPLKVRTIGGRPTLRISRITEHDVHVNGMTIPGLPGVAVQPTTDDGAGGLRAAREYDLQLTIKGRKSGVERGLIQITMVYQ